MKPLKHPSGIDERVVEKVVGRRGRLHAFETLNPLTTALVVIDMDVGTAERIKDGWDLDTFQDTLNNLARAVRSHGGVVAWVTTPIAKATPNFIAQYGEKQARMYEIEEAPDGSSYSIWPALTVVPEDVRATKKGHSAFFPGKNTLHEQLQARGITSLLIAGTVTNVCCEASARDAAELEYQVTMVSDVLLGHKEGQHEATLATFYRNYGDVRPSSDIIELLNLAS